MIIHQHRHDERIRETAHLEHRIPRTRAQRHPVRADAQARHPVLVPSEHTNALAFQSVPHVAVEIVVAGKEQATGHGEGNGRDAAEDVVVGILVQLAVGAEVKQSARSVVGTRSEGIAVREESICRLHQIREQTDQRVDTTH